MAQYDLDELDLGKNEVVKIDSIVLNKTVDIPEFDCSRKEVEVSVTIATINSECMHSCYSQQT